MSNEKKPGCLGCIGEEILPNYMGILISQHKDPYKPTRIQWKAGGFFFQIGHSEGETLPLVEVPTKISRMCGKKKDADR